MWLNPTNLKGVNSFAPAIFLVKQFFSKMTILQLWLICHVFIVLNVANEYFL